LQQDLWGDVVWSAHEFLFAFEVGQVVFEDCEAEVDDFYALNALFVFF
jgi:hypothetical protein